MSTHYEWKIEIHPNHQEDIDDIEFWDTIEELNQSIANIDDPIDICLYKTVVDEEGSRKSFNHFYVDWENNTLSAGDMADVQAPKKYKDMVCKILRPKIVFNPEISEESCEFD